MLNSSNPIPSNAKIAAKRNELNTLPDNGRKKQQINVKDNFWPVTGRSKGVLDMWFRDLAGAKPLANLAKKAPSFNKKEEIFNYLCDHNVSMKKAMWFLKLSAAYTTTVTEQKIKKRQIPDPSIEWTATVIRVMKDLSSKLVEHCTLEKLPKQAKCAPLAASKCARCAIDRRLMPARSPRDKAGQSGGAAKERIGPDGKVVKGKSLREKVLSRSLLKDARFREMKMAKRKLIMADMPPAKKVKRSMKVARMKAATRTRLEQQQQQQQPDQPKGAADASAADELQLSAADAATGGDKGGDAAASVDLKEKSTSKLLRKRIAMRKRYGLQSISQIIADLLAKRAKKRAKQRLNELASEQTAAAATQMEVDEQKDAAKSAAAGQPGKSASAAANVAAGASTTAATATPASPSSAATSSSGAEASATNTPVAVTTTTNMTSGTIVAAAAVSPASASPAVSSTPATSAPGPGAGGSSSHQFIAPAVPPAPSTPQHSNPADDYVALLKQWKYCSRLCKAMCEESLLDRHEFLQWALELLDRMKNKTSDDGFLKLFLPFILQCLPFIVESERLSRVLAYLVCKKIGFMLQYVSEEDTAGPKKAHHQALAAAAANCDPNASSRLDASLKLKTEPEIRAPLSTRSGTRFKKVTKMEPPTSPAIPSEPASPASALLDSPEDTKPASFLSPSRPNSAPDKKNFGARFSPSSSSSSSLATMKSPTMSSPPTSSPPSTAGQSLSMGPSPGAVPHKQPTPNKGLALTVRHRCKPSAQFMETLLHDFLLCAHHRPVIMELSAMVSF